MARNIKQGENVVQEIVDGLQQTMNEGEKSVNVYVAPNKMPIVNQFALMFNTAFLQTIDDYKLTLNDVRVLLKIVELMRFGNLVRISWNQVAKQLNMASSNVSRHVKNLKKALLLIEDAKDGNMYLNPHIIAKGKFLDRGDEDTIHVLNLGAEALEGTSVKPSIITNQIRKKQHKNELEYEQNYLWTDEKKGE